MLITPARAIADRNLLGRGFPPTAEGLDSWMRWRAILKAMYGEELNLFERSLFRAVAGGREAPSRPVKFAWVIAGRRSGKTAISSAIAVTAAMGDYRKYLRYGEKATIVCLANGKLQAKIAYGFIRGAFLANPMLAALVEREGEFSLELNTGIEILVLANNYRSIRGRTILAAILDECPVAGTLVETATGPVPIENLRPGDQVWTRQGLRPVKKARMTDRLASVHEVTFSDGRTLAGTANHPVFVHGKGFVPVQSLMIGDEVLTWPEIVSTVVQRSAHEAGAEDAGPVGQNIGLPCYPSTASRSSSGADVAGISPRMAIGRTAMASFCIARSIAQLMTSLPTTWRSITKTATERISRSLTSKLSLRRSIIASMVQEGFVLGLPNSATRSLAAASASCGTSANQWSGFARFAESRSAQPGCGRGSAAPSVRAPVTAAKAVSHGSRPASIAALKLRDWFKGERARRNTAAMNARTPSGGAATTPVRVRSVRTCADPAPVYNLQVDEVPEYFANGVLTHNCAFWRSDESANPDIETYTALVPSLVTLPNSLLIGISSAYRKSGLIYDQYKLYFGINDPDVLVVKGATRQFNPTVPQSFIEQELVRDPEAAAAEWLSEFRSDLADYIQREVIEDAVDPDCRERPPSWGLKYLAFVDPSGGSGDPMTLAIAHRETDGQLILDCLRERAPPFSPESTVEDFCDTLKTYRIGRVTGDRYAGEWPREQFRKRSIAYQVAERAKTDIYREALPLFNSGRIRLLDTPRLVNQLISLERKTGRGTGKDVIDHPRGEHDDLANACCGALTLAAAKNPLIIDPGVLERSMRPMTYSNGRGPGHWDNGYWVSHRFG